MYFSMTLCSCAMVFDGFLASLEEHGPGHTPLTAARITVSSVISRVLALSERTSARNPVEVLARLECK